jgi:hypothetical protein
MPRLPLLDPAALRYADRLFTDHHAVDDAQWDQLRLGIRHGGHAHV